MRGDFIPLVAIGAVNVLGTEGGTLSWITPVTQGGALVLLALYLLWSMRERKEERAERAREDQLERESRIEEIKAIAASHKESLAQTIAALQRAYEKETKQ